MKRIFILTVALLLTTTFTFAETSEGKGAIIEELEQKTKPALNPFFQRQ